MLSNPSLFDVVKLIPILGFAILLYHLYSTRLHQKYFYFTL